MINTLLAILICIIILIALLCLYMIATFLSEFKSFFVIPRIKWDRDKEMDPITPEEQLRRKMNRMEE